MSTRPTTPIPHWATTGAKTQPSAGKQAQGWLVNERPPAEFWNWLQNSTGTWLQFFHDLTTGSPTPDLKLDFSSPANAAPVTFSATANVAPCVDVTPVPAAANYKLLLRAKTSPTTHVHLYAGSTRRKLVLVHNAVWTGTRWHVEDPASGPPTGVTVVQLTDKSACELIWREAIAGDWVDASWQKGNILVENVVGAGFAADLITAATLVGTIAVDAATLTVHNLATLESDLHVAGQIQTNSLLLQESNAILRPEVELQYMGVNGLVTELPRRYINIALSQGKAWADVATLPQHQGANGVWVPGNGPCRIEFPFTVPYGCPHIQCYAVYRSRDPAGPNKLALWHWARSFNDTAGLMPPPSAGEELAVKVQTLFSNGAGPGENNLVVCETLNYGVPDGVDPGTDRYAIVITLDSSVGAALFGAAVAFRDPGPRNY